MILVVEVTIFHNCFRSGILEYLVEFNLKIDCLGTFLA